MLARPLVLALLAACTSAPTTAPVDDGGEPIDAPLGERDARPASGPCAAAAALPPVDQDLVLTVAGHDRHYRLHLPPTYDRQPTPLVLNFHGLGSSGAHQASSSQMDAAADRDGYVVAYPDGSGTPRGWNAGVCCGTAASQQVDDVGFATALIDRLEQDLCVDRRRIYATGFSNGGFLGHRLGCELADRLAAVAPVSGVIGIDPCRPARPIALIEFHGDADPAVPFGGNPLLGFPSVADTIAGWVARDGCAATATAGDGAGCARYGGCQAGVEVELCTIPGGGHAWPHAPAAIDADATMWRFFARHSLP